MTQSHAQPGHPAHLAHHFDSSEQQAASGKLGMWLFLATELLMFGGLFCGYSVYRANHPEVFHFAAQYLDTTLGGINTAVLITSSFTMAYAVRAVQTNQRRLAVACMALTILGGAGFMGIKYVEYRHKWKDGLLWGKYYNPHDETTTRPGEAAAAIPPNASATTASVATLPTAGTGAATRPAPTVALPFGAAPPELRSLLPEPAASPPGLAKPDAAAEHEKEPANVKTFFAVYFCMTGLHGLHVLVGMGLIAWVLRRTAAGQFSDQYFTPVDLVGLYWHLVDLIWIFLFPLLYLIH